MPPPLIRGIGFDVVAMTTPVGRGEGTTKEDCAKVAENTRCTIIGEFGDDPLPIDLDRWTPSLLAVDDKRAGFPELCLRT